MKAIKLLIPILMMTGSLSLCAEEEQQESQQKEVQAAETLLNENQLASLDFEALAKNVPAEAPKLTDIFKESENTFCLLCYNLAGERVPYNQGFCYINGEFCHVADYSYQSIITVFEGPRCGLQTCVSYSGLILSTNTACTLNKVYGGIIFEHQYPDCVVVTGVDQVVYFY